MTDEEAIPLSEYDRRWTSLLELVRDAGLDCLCVTSPIGIEYLTGHDGRGADMAPYVLIVAPGRPRTLIARLMERRSIIRESISLEIRTYFSGREDAIPIWTACMQELDLADAHVGLELDHWGLTPMDVHDFQAALPAADVSDASTLVSRTVDRKSAVEIEIMRRAMQLTEVGIEEFYSALSPGISERDVETQVLAAIRREGGFVDGSETNTLFGARTVLPHGIAGSNTLRINDVATLETSAYLHSYTAPLGRTVIYGANARAEALHQVAEDAVDAALSTLRPGVMAGDVDEAARSIVRRAGLDQSFNHRIGYSAGLRWNFRGGMSIRPGSEATIEESMTLHIICFLYDAEDSLGVVTGDTVLVTEAGYEKLSRLPRDLRRLTPVS